MRDITVQEFYASAKVKGRAVLAGTRDDPRVWLTRPSRYENMFCLCYHDRDGIGFVDGTTPMKDLSRLVNTALDRARLARIDSWYRTVSRVSLTAGTQHPDHCCLEI